MEPIKAAMDKEKANKSTKKVKTVEEMMKASELKAFLKLAEERELAEKEAREQIFLQKE
jgi:hypothetical protein